MSNFKHFTTEEAFAPFISSCIEAESVLSISAAQCALSSRRSLELAVKWVYKVDAELKMPYRDNLSSLIHYNEFKDILEDGIFTHLKYIISLGNASAHTAKQISRDEAVTSLRYLHEFISFLAWCYTDIDSDKPFDERMLPKAGRNRLTEEQIEQQRKVIQEKEAELEKLFKDNERLQQELNNTKNQKLEQHFEYTSPDDLNEYQTRKRYIDVSLKEAGWELGKDCIVEYPVVGMPNQSGSGFVDYVLFDNDGKPLAVVEAKRTSADPIKGRQQAKLYADCLEKQFGRRPVIFYTNGFETTIWDDAMYPPRRVWGFYTKDGLRRIIQRRRERLPFDSIDIKEEITNRYYQKEAIRAVCQHFAKKHRRSLLVMATGSGKTRTAISLVDVLLRYGWVKNVLFLADRTELVRQAKGNFTVHLPDEPLCNLVEESDRENINARIVFSTYPTIMNSIDGIKAKDGMRIFTPDHFDLIIMDEAHRSIYNKYKEVFEYFDSLLLGLTATPKSDIDHNTYSIFELEDNNPTYNYPLNVAVNTDHVLVGFERVEVKLKNLFEGLKYDELSEDEKEHFEETFADEEGDMPDELLPNDFMSWIMNDQTIDNVFYNLMDTGIKIKQGDSLGKTIIFAQNHKHAEAIQKRFNILYPHLMGGFARVIDNYENYASSIISDFKKPNSKPWIAISVDMLDTGIDVPEIVNLVFFKKVRSRAKFWQMIGRGTRLCENLFAPGEDKEKFIIFDYCGNFEFFEIKPKGHETKERFSITHRLYMLKSKIIRALQDVRYTGNVELEDYRNRLIIEQVADIERLNRDSFVVRNHLKYYDFYRQKASWKVLQEKEITELSEHIAPIIIPSNADDGAKLFDNLIYSIELNILCSYSIKRSVNRVQDITQKLSKLGTIPQVAENQQLIAEVMTAEFWERADILDCERIRKILRELIKFIESVQRRTLVTHFNETVISVSQSEGDLGDDEFMRPYNERVNQYVLSNQNNIVIHKIKTNQQLTNKDIEALEMILFNEVGTKEEYINEYHNTPVGKLIRSIVGLDQEVANEVFSAFLSNTDFNQKQLHFVKTIISHIVRNGYMDLAEFQREPFKSQGSIVQLFDNKRIEELKSVIKGINNNVAG